MDMGIGNRITNNQFYAFLIESHIFLFRYYLIINDLFSCVCNGVRIVCCE